MQKNIEINLHSRDKIFKTFLKRCQNYLEMIQNACYKLYFTLQVKCNFT